LSLPYKSEDLSETCSRYPQLASVSGQNSIDNNTVAFKLPSLRLLVFYSKSKSSLAKDNILITLNPPQVLIMKKIALFLICLLMIISRSYAVNPPLRIAVSHYMPPFVIQGANNQFYGFDIAMMEFICTHLDRDCQFYPMSFDKLLDAVINKKVDVAVSSITITADRAQLVNFSSPYLPSRSRFVATSKLAAEKYTPTLLDNKKIGIQKGTIFSDQIKSINIKNPTITYFDSEEDTISALTNAEVDLILIDAPAALYWQNYTSNTIQAIGTPLPFGFGFGIVINREDTPLLQAVNAILVLYEKSDDFKKNYNTYLQTF